jgi:hypothetical protein
MVMTINPPPLNIPAGLPPEMREYIQYLNTLLRQISQALGPTGVVGVGNGGTNITTYAVGDLLVASGAEELSRFAMGAANQLLGVNAGALYPEYKTLNQVSGRTHITYSTGSITFDISANYAGQASIETVGTLTAGVWNATEIAAAHGGTGQTSYAVGDILYATGATAIAKLALGSANRVLGVNNAGTAPEYKAITQTANQVLVNHSAGAITLSTPQDIHTAADVTFNSVTATNGFGCNGKSAQVEFAVPSAITATAGATYTAAEQNMLNDIKALLNAVRTANVNNGIAV